MSERTKRVALRAAHVADELMGFLVALADAVRADTEFSTGYWDVISPAISIRADLVTLLENYGFDSAALIHVPQLPDVEDCDPDQLWSLPQDISNQSAVSQ